MRGIILAGGSGKRLYPLTLATSKHLLPIYDKPMIYYPLSTLMMAGIQEILIITKPCDLQSYCELLGDGSRFGVKLNFKVQEQPTGVAQALTLAEDFLQDNRCTLILGDNIFYGNGFEELLKNAVRNVKTNGGAQVFAHPVTMPERYGVVELGIDGRIVSLEEKPQKPKSNYAVTGLYVYDSRAVKFAKSIKLSSRHEYEITDVNKLYLESNELNVTVLDSKTYNWFDAGTIDNLMEAASCIKAIQGMNKKLVAVPEEIAYNNSWITKKDLAHAAQWQGETSYGEYLMQLAKNK